jgi:imidazolonepropionase-like amidohydrolase
MMPTRREFLTTVAVGGLLGGRALKGQTPRASLPSVDLGDTVERLAIRNVTVIDMTGRSPIRNATVVLDGNRIVTVDRAPADRQDVTVIDGTGKFLIPGLWDMHTHPDLRTLSMFIANGVTGIRCMRASPEDLVGRDDIAGGRRLGPQFVAGLYLNGPAQGETFEHWTIVATVEKAREAVRRGSREGYEFIKVYNRLPRDAYFAITEEARAQGLPVVGHVPWAVTAAECCNVGQRSLEHLTFAGRVCIDRYEEWRQSAASNPSAVRGFDEFQPSVESFQVSRAAPLIQIMRKNKTWVCPTLIGSARIASGPQSADDPRLKFVSSEVKAWWAHPQFPSTPRTRREHSQYMEIAQLLYKSGVGLLAGTDVGWTPFTYTGFSLHEELQLLVDAGLTPFDALRAATSAPAEFLGMREHLGTVEAGKRAELVLLDGDPLMDISNTQRIHAVVSRGRLYRRPALDKMLEFAEADART